MIFYCRRGFAWEIKDLCIRQHASVKLEGGSLGRQNDPHWVSGPEIRGSELISLFVYQSKAFNEGDSNGATIKRFVTRQLHNGSKENYNTPSDSIDQREKSMISKHWLEIGDLYKNRSRVGKSGFHAFFILLLNNVYEREREMRERERLYIMRTKIIINWLYIIICR